MHVTFLTKMWWKSYNPVHPRCHGMSQWLAHCGTWSKTKKLIKVNMKPKNLIHLFPNAVGEL